MDKREENLQKIINIVSKGDTRPVEMLFNKPGGRKHLEMIVSIVVSNLPYEHYEKLDLFAAFVETLDNLEERIKHQKQGQRILSQVYNQ